jgi:hypothetical protein
MWVFFYSPMEYFINLTSHLQLVARDPYCIRIKGRGCKREPVPIPEPVPDPEHVAEIDARDPYSQISRDSSEHSAESS